MDFKKALDAKRAAAQNKPQEKDPSEMSPSELDRALEETQREIRQLKEQQVRAGRQGLADSQSRSRFLFPRRSRRPWK